MYKGFRNILLVLLLLAGSLPAAGQRAPRAKTQVGIPLRGEEEIVQPQLPSVCYGSVERYGVKGQEGSHFEWRVYTIVDGREVLVPGVVPIGNGGEVEVQWWMSGLELGGLYTLAVKETTEQGCEGVEYKTDVMVNTHTLVLPNLREEIFFCENEECQIDESRLKELERFRDFSFFYLPDGDGVFNLPPIYATRKDETLKLRLVGSAGCTFGEVKTTGRAAPTIDLGPDRTIMEYESVELDAGSAVYSHYEWATDNRNVAWLSQLSSLTSSVTAYGKDGTQRVWLTVTDENGCKGRDTVLVSVMGLDGLRIPAAFTPNGDGVNDTWVVPAPTGIPLVLEMVEISDVRVYDRTGTLVWRCGSNYTPWDGRDLNGRPLPMDSYHYELRASVRGDSRLFRGSVTIVR